jgi:alkanesulfonate monooxygenase SsuD/methylene tetrahydromethanopterin reductase-like flavin-dependent oxidoreductase (luciferase family)
MRSGVNDLTFGWKASQQQAGIDDQRAVWREVDESGFDSIWLFDHFLAMGGGRRSGDILEAWTLLGALAEATRRVRIGTLVTSNLYRHPGILAKMAVTVDHVSAGRLVMGLGAGGDPEADPRLGLPDLGARDRIDRLDEACQVLTSLWTQPVTTFTGKHYTIDGLESDPKPVQRPHPPLWLASNGARYGLRVVARRADVWLAASMGPDDHAELAALSRALDRHCADAGRDPATIRRAVQFRMPDGADETLRAAERYVAGGFTDLVLLSRRGAEALAGAVALLPRLRALGD